VVIAVSFDEDVEIARLCAREEAGVPLTYPVLIDRDHVLAELYGVANVPTTVWIDENDRIVRPPTQAPADDKFRDFSGIDSSIHNNALRAWVRDGVRPFSDEEVRARQAAPTPELSRARAERRLAMHLLRTGHDDAAWAHLERALELAPTDWTIQRGSLPVRGLDPFGQPFFDFYQRWQAAGAPGYPGDPPIGSGAKKGMDGTER
jgi:hypothetical protein